MFGNTYTVVGVESNNNETVLNQHKNYDECLRFARKYSKGESGYEYILIYCHPYDDPLNKLQDRVYECGSGAETIF